MPTAVAFLPHPLCAISGRKLLIIPILPILLVFFHLFFLPVISFHQLLHLFKVIIYLIEKWNLGFTKVRQVLYH